MAHIGGFPEFGHGEFQEGGEYFTPEEVWGQFAARQPGRQFWQARAPLQDIGQRLQARYLLAAPEMAVADTPETFAQYLRDWPRGASPGYIAQDRQVLQNRAWQAALAGVAPAGEYEAGYEGQVFEPGEATRRAWLGQQFGPAGEQSQLNQLRVAQLLGMQRQGRGGAYTGGLGAAVRNAIQRMRNYYVATGNPKENFLRWYMERQGMGGAELPTAPNGPPPVTVPPQVPVNPEDRSTWTDDFRDAIQAILSRTAADNPSGLPGTGITGHLWDEDEAARLAAEAIAKGPPKTPSGPLEWDAENTRWYQPMV